MSKSNEQPYKNKITNEANKRPKATKLEKFVGAVAATALVLTAKGVVETSNQNANVDEATMGQDNAVVVEVGETESAPEPAFSMDAMIRPGKGPIDAINQALVDVRENSADENGVVDSELEDLLKGIDTHFYGNKLNKLVLEDTGQEFVIAGQRLPINVYSDGSMSYLGQKGIYDISSGDMTPYPEEPPSQP